MSIISVNKVVDTESRKEGSLDRGEKRDRKSLIIMYLLHLNQRKDVSLLIFCMKNLQGGVECYLDLITLEKKSHVICWWLNESFTHVLDFFFN